MPEQARTDAETLARYAAGGTAAAAAFERLVAEHGGMVHRVCLRVLGRRDLAEEAAQAAFLVLARRARSVREDVGAFLHGVALRVALRARESELARGAREKEAAMLGAQRAASGAADWERLRPHLDEAVARLPAGERAAVTLHYLEGRPYGEVARRLGVPEGTVASRLNRALERLRGFFRKRDIELSVAALGPVLAAGLVGSGTVCPEFLAAAAAKLAAAGHAGTVGTAGIGANVAALSKGVLDMMFWAKVKVTIVYVAAAAVLGVGTPLVLRAVSAESAPAQPGQPAAAPGEAQADEPVAVDGIRLTLSADRTEAKAGGEIKLTVTFENVSKEKLRVFWPVRQFLSDQVSLEAAGDGVVERGPQMRNMMALLPGLDNYPELAPGEKKSLQLAIAGNPPTVAALGVYFTKEGSYKLRIVYAYRDANPVLHTLEDEGKPVPGKVWAGQVETQELEIKLTGEFGPAPLPNRGVRMRVPEELMPDRNPQPLPPPMEEM